MSLIWNVSARFEFIQATGYYGHIEAELGDRFISAVEAAIARLRSNPEMFRRFEGDMRKVPVEGFPYAVIYCIEEQGLNLVSVMHSSRQPGYWRERLN
jgi:toxin ParE1/3/4